MSEDLAANLRNYQIQLQQVEAALSNEQDNEELNKLKHDLIVMLFYYSIIVIYLYFFLGSHHFDKTVDE